MLTYTSRRNLFGTLSSDSGAANLEVGDTLINEADREVINAKPWRFREKTLTKSTVASQQFYYIGEGRVRNVTVTIGSTRYTPTEVTTIDDWDRLNQSTSTSDTPEYFFVSDGRIGFYPTPSTSTSNAITVNLFRGHKDLTIADYTTGTITTTSGTTITGSGTTWTEKMAGRWLRITDSNTANTGDGEWYEISSVTSSTVLELASPYLGTAITAGSATYTIGQTSIIPGDFHMVSVHRAVEQYFSFIQPEKERAALAKENYAEGLKRMQVELGGTSI
jgi:hypothetical protein